MVMIVDTPTLATLLGRAAVEALAALREVSDTARGLGLETEPPPLAAPRDPGDPDGNLVGLAGR